MPKNLGRRVASGALLSFAASAVVAATSSHGYDPQQAQVLEGVPAHVVLLNDRLKAQIPYQYRSLDSWQWQNIHNTPGVDPLTGAVGGAIAIAIVNAAERASAEDKVETAYAALRAAQCDIDASTVILPVVEARIRSTPWGTNTQVNQHRAEDNRKLDNQLEKSGPRYVFEVSYSLTHDFSAVVTTLSARAYLPDANGRVRKNKPAWQNMIYVVSDRQQLPTKTPVDIDAAIAAENERYAATPAIELIRKANAGDLQARKKAAPLVKRHELNLREARKEDWTPAQGAAYLERKWSADGCALLNQVVQANALELDDVLQRLFAGDLPSQPEDAVFNPMVWQSAEVEGERNAFAWPSGHVLVRRGGDLLPLNFAGSWAKAL